MLINFLSALNLLLSKLMKELVKSQLQDQLTEAKILYQWFSDRVGYYSHGFHCQMKLAHTPPAKPDWEAAVSGVGAPTCIGFIW